MPEPLSHSYQSTNHEDCLTLPGSTVKLQMSPSGIVPEQLRDAGCGNSLEIQLKSFLMSQLPTPSLAGLWSSRAMVRSFGVVSSPRRS